MGKRIVDTGIQNRIRRLSEAARASERAAEDDRSERNLAIGEGKAAGLTLMDIVALSGIGLTQVQRIVVEYDTSHS